MKQAKPRRHKPRRITVKLVEEGRETVLYDCKDKRITQDEELEEIFQMLRGKY